MGLGRQGGGVSGTQGDIKHTKDVGVGDFGTDGAIGFKHGIPSEFVRDGQVGVPIGDIFGDQQPKAEEWGGPLNKVKIKFFHV